MITSASNIHIETTGAGPHLVFIHGWGMNSTVWKHLVKQLSKSFTVHLVDLPGMGYSETISPYDLSSVAEKIAELMPNNTLMVGWSLGGQVAMRIALDQPEAIKKLVLVGATPCFVNVKGLTTRPHWSVGVEQQVFEKFSHNVTQDYNKTMMNFLALQCMGSRSAMSTLRTLRKQFMAAPAPKDQTLQSALDILLTTDLRQVFDQITQPTLIIHGDKDTLAPVQTANWMAQQLPNASLRVIAGASHAPFLSHTAEFLDALLPFINTETRRI